MTINDPHEDPRYQVGGTKYKPPFDRSGSEAVSAQEVAKLHEKADTDSSQTAIHHTLGTKHDMASAGDHDHNGSNSRKIMAGVTITGAKGGNAALTDFLTKASAALGFTDNTT